MKLIQETVFQHVVLPSIKIICLLKKMMDLKNPNWFHLIDFIIFFPPALCFWHSVPQTLNKTNNTYQKSRQGRQQGGYSGLKSLLEGCSPKRYASTIQTLLMGRGNISDGYIALQPQSPFQPEADKLSHFILEPSETRDASGKEQRDF